MVKVLKFNYYSATKLTHVCSVQLKSPLFNSNANKEPFVKINYIAYNYEKIIQNQSSLEIFTSIQNEYKITYGVDYSNAFFVYRHGDVLEVAINEYPNVSGTIETAYPGLVNIDTYEVPDASLYTKIAFNETPVTQLNRATFAAANTPYTVKTAQRLLMFIINAETNATKVILIEGGKIHGDTDNIGTATIENGVTTATFTIGQNAWYVIR